MVVLVAKSQSCVAIMLRRLGILRLAGSLVLAGTVTSQSSSISGLGPSAYTAPGTFPTSVYEAYYNDPTATTAEPQPVITDPITVSLSEKSCIGRCSRSTHKARDLSLLFNESGNHFASTQILFL